MGSRTVQFEGTWEELLAHATEFAGRRVRLTVLPDAAPAPDEPTLTPKNQHRLEFLREWQRTPLTEEEEAILDEFEQFRKEQPFSLRRIKDP